MISHEHLVSVHGSDETCSHDCGKSCVEVLERYDYVWK